MGATSDIDHLVNQSLSMIQGKLGAERPAFIAKAKALVAKRAAEIAALADALNAADSIERFSEHHMIFTAHDRLMLLSSALKFEACQPYAGSRAAVNSYMSSVVRDRNILGHAVIVPEGKPTAVTHGSGKTMSLAETRELRKLILRLRDEFRGLFAALGTNG
jgi:hypothetical protein